MSKFQSLILFYRILFWVFIASSISHTGYVLTWNPVGNSIGINTAGNINIGLMVAGALFGLFNFMVNTVALVFFLIWIYRAYSNLYLFTDKRLKYSPGWAVGYFLIPVANLFMPYLVTTEILRHSNPINFGELYNGKPEKPSFLIVNLWWTSFILPIIFSVSFIIYLILIGHFPYNMAEFSNIPVIKICSVLFTIFEVTMTILMLRQITKLQESKFYAMKDAVLDKATIN